MGGRIKKSKKQSDGNPEQSLLDPLVFFLDETIHNCQPIHKSLEALAVKYVRHGSIFEPGVLDKDWLPFVGEKRWIVLTSDKRIRFNQLEREQVTAYGVREFVFSSGNLSGTMMGEILKIAMPRIRKIFAEQTPPFIACITQSGSVEVRYDKDGSVHARKKKESKTD